LSTFTPEAPAPDALPLAGLLVAEFTHTIMGPSCGLVLADLGAEVIRIEPAPAGDPTRGLPGFASGFFTVFNRNKAHLALDLKAAAGRAVAERLIERADVLIENFAPGTMQRLGLGYEDAARNNPRLIYCSLKGFLSGPYERRVALDEVVQMMGGLAYMTGPPGMPLRAGASVIDILGGTFGAVAILAALRERDRTGKGQLVESALFESVVYLMGQHMAAAKILNRAIPPFPARIGAWGIYDLFVTRDGIQVFLGVTTDRTWERFCGEFARADLLADARLRGNTERVNERDWLVPELARMVAELDAAEVTARCERAGLPFATIGAPEDLFDDPHLLAGERLLPTRGPSDETIPLPQLPIAMNGRSFGIRSQPSKLGENAGAVLEQLGYAGDEIAQLARDGVTVLA
jgi:crotonobetainyl-CoA:carnitine CoA-transferase CaiB-like acyl-CoA transferase